MLFFASRPVTHKDAFEMMSEIKAGHILEGVRGRAPRDKDVLADIIVALSRLISENPHISSVDLILYCLLTRAHAWWMQK